MLKALCTPILFRSRVLTKTLLIMNFTAILIVAVTLTASAASHGQSISLDLKNQPLEKLFTQLRKQTNYNVVYYKNDLLNAKKITLRVENVDLHEVLKIAFNDQPLTYTIIDNSIIVKSKPEIPGLTPENDLNPSLNTPPISGIIRDADGNPLGGVNIVIKGTKKGVTTDANGKFSIEANANDVLIISSIGFNVKEVRINSTNTALIVALEKSISPLDEVQIIAYGKTTQRFSTGNVGTVKAADIEKQPVNNPLLALQGRVPGLFIEQATGFAGTGVKVRIQGQNSIANGNDPLYVIDGVPFISQLLPVVSAGTGSEYIFGTSGSGSYSNPLNFINPSDIESIDVLKDADATAIYGSRAANGAILITTKQGKAGDIRVNAKLQAGWGEVARRMDLMNTTQYLEMRREALKNDGIAAPAPGPFGDNDLNGNWDTTRNTDWQKELIGGKAQYRDAQVSMGGGAGNTNFLVGVGYHKEGNVFAGDFSDTKSSVHFTLNSASSNQRLKIQFSGSYLDDNNQLPNLDLTNAAMTLAPVAPPLYTADGKLNWQQVQDFSTFLYNPMPYLFSKFNTRTSNLIGNGILAYRIGKGLEIKSSFGYTRLQSASLKYQTSESAPPEYKQYLNLATNFGNSLITSWLVEPQLNYRRNIARGQLEVLLGSTIQQRNNDGSYIEALGFATEQVMEDIKSATQINAISSINSEYKYNALFGRINYNWDDKYIVNLTARRDGSSRFGSENQFHNFGAIGAAWLFSQESFIKDNLAFLSFGKIRASYGTTGSDQIDDYRFLSLYDGTTGNSAPYQGVNGYRPNSLTNAYLQWEETRKLQVGLDLGFIKDKILLSTNYFLNRSSNQLLSLGLPVITGFYAISANLPATVENSGWEMMLSVTNLNLSHFKWTSSFNLTIPRNKLLSVVDFENSPLKGIYVIGQSINRNILFHFLGVDPATGVYKFQDLQGNPTTSPAYEDRYVVINTDPAYYGGFQNSFEYKGFQLDVFFQFTKQIAQNSLFGQRVAGRFYFGDGNGPESQIYRWQKPGDIASVPRYTTAYDADAPLYNASLTDVAWSDASYIRLKNVSLSWQLPIEWRKKIHFQSCRFYVQGQNLLTITKYAGLDPESKSSRSLPPLRVITMGLQIGL